MLARQRVVAEALLTRRLCCQMVPLDEKRSVAASLIICAKYQPSLDEQRARESGSSPTTGTRIASQ